MAPTNRSTEQTSQEPLGMPEKRKYPRFQRTFTVTLNGVSFSGYDISLEGVSFSTTETIETIRKGRLYANVQILSQQGMTYRIAALVISSVRQRDEITFYGARIVNLDDALRPMHEQLVFDKFDVDSLLTHTCVPDKAKMSEHLESRLNEAIKLLQNVYVDHLPPELIMVRDELNCLHPNLAKIEVLIKRNPEVLAIFIKIARLAYPKKSIDQLMKIGTILKLIGIDQVYDLFVSAIMIRFHENNPLEYNIMMHGMNAGLAAAELSDSIEGISRSEAYLAGLMQNIGAVFLSKVDPEAYKYIFRKSLSLPYTAYDQELVTFNTSHCEVGVVIAKKWQMEPEVYKGILLHHSRHISSEIKQTHNKICNMGLLMMLSDYVACSAMGKNYVSDELKSSRDYALSHLTVDEKNVRSAYKIVMTSGNKLPYLSHF
ncbi:HDOD domain-containing protein [Thiomicrospira pelophila]|uniref:HDOD domain-containing protein n=1 Tax=Thiomicrospira pelophila TaxID=934 RepID=UPI0004A6BE96|nr:HDOD domain-containing protein [Thiomicrospira pelophila]